jgi:3-oxoadipate enol-lactonase
MIFLWSATQSVAIYAAPAGHFLRWQLHAGKTAMSYFTTTDGCVLFYTSYGLETAKPVVVFLNGTTQSTLYWGNCVPAFSKNHGLLFYDARGQGQSDLGPTALTLDLHADDLKGLLNHLAVDRAHLVGVSHGARVAMNFAARHPAMLDHLVMCALGASMAGRPRAIVQSWLKILQLSGLEAMAWAALPVVFGPTFLNAQGRMLDKIVNAVVRRNDRQALAAQLEAILAYPPPERLPADFDRPVLVLSGAQDLLVDPKSARQLAELCRGHYRLLDDTGHSIPAEVPELFAKLVLDFF